MKATHGRVDRVVERLAAGLIGWRRSLSLLFVTLTCVFGWSATRLQLDPGFLKLIPIEHPYMKTMMEHLQNFPGANTIIVNVRWKGDGDMYNKRFMEVLSSTTDGMFLIPGINRAKISSIFTPASWYIEITEEGFSGEPVVPAEYSGEPEQLQKIRKNVTLGGYLGLLVANDQKAAMIRADLLDYDPKAEKGKGVDYWLVQGRLEELRGRIENPKKYIYRLTHDQGPLKAGTAVAEGYVDNGILQGTQKYEFRYQTPEGETIKIAVDGADVTREIADNPDYNPDIEINVIGFSRLLGDVMKGLIGVLAFFGLAFGVTVLLLYWYTRSIKLSIVAIAVAALPVIWLLGVLPMIGLGVDPMSILIPFLIFSIGVSHAVQMTNAFRQEYVRVQDSRKAARQSFRKLFVPGAVALLTNALGFAVIMIIDIPIVHELGVTACIGVLLMIATNKMILPIILSYLQLDERGLTTVSTARSDRVWAFVSRSASPSASLKIIGVCLVLLFLATVTSRGLTIGDSGTGAPELREDSRYNLDSRQIAASYDIGVDVLTVIVEAKDFEGDSCLHHDVVGTIDRFEVFMRGVDGVRSVVSVASVGKLVLSAFGEGNPRWRSLPHSQTGLSTAARAFDPTLGLNTDECRAIQVMIFTRDHDGHTVSHVVAEAKRFIAANPVQGVKLKLASGSVGVMAAMNEAVADAEVTMLLSIFLALTLLCLVTFRSIKATVCVLVPLALVSVFCNALMTALGIGLKVATLPVIALGIGVGVDYGIYLFEHILHDMRRRGLDFQAAFLEAMRARGTAAVFTAVTMSVAVGTWTISALKFQADMGLLLAFMFLVNMLGAIALLPALGIQFFIRGEGVGVRSGSRSDRATVANS